MASKSNMTLRIEPELKEQAAALFKSLGLDLSGAVPSWMGVISMFDVVTYV